MKTALIISRCRFPFSALIYTVICIALRHKTAMLSHILSMRGEERAVTDDIYSRRLSQKTKGTHKFQTGDM
jgi:hypothetical protein